MIHNIRNIRPGKEWLELVQAGEHDEAARLNEKLLEKCCVILLLGGREGYPAMFEHLGGVGHMLMDLGQHSYAVPWFSKLCEFTSLFAPNEPDSVSDLYWYATCLYESGNKRLALENLSRASKQYQTIGMSNEKLKRAIDTNIEAWSNDG